MYFVLEGKVACSIKNMDNDDQKANALIQKQQEERKDKKKTQKSSMPSIDMQKASADTGTFLT